MLNRPSATHPSQIFLWIHPCSNNSKTRLEAFVYALTWNGLGFDFLRDSTKPFGWFSDSFTQVAKWKRKRLLSSPKKFVKTNAIFPPFCDLRIRKAGAYQRLLTSKYFLRSMRKQNAHLLLSVEKGQLFGWYPVNSPTCKLAYTNSPTPTVNSPT